MEPSQPAEKKRFFGKYNLREWKNQIFATAIVTVGSFGTGTVFGWSATATEDLQNGTEFGEISKDKEIAWVTSLAILGAFVAGPIAGYLMDTIGRKKSIIVFSIPFFIGWGVMYAAHLLQQFFWLYIGRLLTGVCAGANLVIIPTYIKEIATDSLRGVLGTAMPLMLCNGILLTLVVGAYWKWYVMTACCAVPPIVLAIGACFIPESPRFLIVRQQKSSAIAAYKWLYGISSNEIAEERLTVMCLLEMSESGNTDEKQKKKSWRNLFTRPVLFPILIIVFVMFFQQFGGVNAVTMYTVKIFRLAGGDFIHPNTATIIVGVVQVVFVIVSMFLVDLLGRRTLLTSCSFIMGCCLLGLGSYFYLKEKGDGSERSIVWVPVASTWTYVAAYSCGVGSVPWVLASELYNPDYRAESATIMTSAYWIFGFVVAQTYESLKESLHASGSFYFYGAFCIAGSVFAALVVPETKGKSTSDIVAYFSGGGGEKDSSTCHVTNRNYDDETGGGGDMSDSSEPNTEMTPTSFENRTFCVQATNNPDLIIISNNNTDRVNV